MNVMEQTIEQNEPLVLEALHAFMETTYRLEAELSLVVSNLSKE